MNFKELTHIYTDPKVITYLNQKITESITTFRKKGIKKPKGQWDEKDIFLITYGDQFYRENEKKMITFKGFYDEFLSSMFNIIHFLPFYPYTSDDGFSVVDYEKVNPEIGDWDDIAKMRESSRLMFDFVCNHMSAKSEWFKHYLDDQEQYVDFFINQDPDVDLSSVTRPRTSPLLTEFEDFRGNTRHVWTTFSADQVDLNLKNPEVLLRLINVLLYYLEQNAEFIRLDAVGFMWKEIGTKSIHLPQTHKIIQLFRSVVEQALPGTVLITETNVPHKENVSYFGDGHNEAQMIYQFPLPPLVLNTIKTENSKYLRAWSKNIQPPSKETTFFNFLASHDGIGLNPIRGIIPEKEIDQLVSLLEEEGALVSYKENNDGSKSPYEINVTYMDALSKKDESDEDRLNRLLIAHSILVTLPGIPAIYIQSVLGSRNYYEGVVETKQNRTINRQKYAINDIETELLNENSLRKKTYEGLRKILSIRKKQKAFHPNATLSVLEAPDELFVYKRTNQAESIYLIHNISQKSVQYQAEFGKYKELMTDEWVDIIEEGITIKPYEFLWLKK